MEDFITFDPTAEINSAAEIISKLSSRNNLLTMALIVSLCAAGYYAYNYYQLLDELD